MEQEPITSERDMLRRQISTTHKKLLAEFNATFRYREEPGLRSAIIADMQALQDGCPHLVPEDQFAHPDFVKCADCGKALDDPSLTIY